MDVTTFQCPHCQATLRMRGRQTAGTRFHCPDCSKPLQISQAPEGQLSLTPVAVESTPQGPSRLAQKTEAGLQTVQSGARYLAASPVLMSWLVAGTGGLLILLLMLFDESPTIPQPQTEPETVADAEQELPNEKTETETPLLVEVTPEPEAKEPVAVPPGPAQPDQRQLENQNLIAAQPDQAPPLVARKPDPMEVPAVPETDVAMALQIPILEFQQPKEIPLKTLIAQFEEMLDTEFQLADNVKNDSRLLETPISFSQKNTTISRLLAQILSEAALTFSVKSNKIYIERAEGS
ncbi:hypothetical protein [Gimesia panareensis]|uniref:hypothetical protein n=1 Tax=Gimesia panareensis TaxID=2527978 RepID=UPI00118A0D77|nr:hypothetical protein [Gimesia panareensis]QDU53340.1 hypothetical protein Pan110_57300 [Gimesia panareensis]